MWIFGVGFFRVYFWEDLDLIRFGDDFVCLAGGCVDVVTWVKFS